MRCAKRVVVTIGLLLAAVPVAAQPQAVAVSNWLVLGPAPDALPAFGTERPGAFGIGELLDDARFPRAPWLPRAGDGESWFGRELTWTPREVDSDGRLALERPENGPASAWLAAYLHVPRWQSAEVELVGTHARRAWLDGQAVARGGTGPAGDEPDAVKGKVKLSTGSHLLIVRTVYDPEVGGDWAIGVRLHGSAEAAPVVHATHEPARTLDLLDILEPPHVTSLAVAPDGQRVAVSYRRVLPGTNEDESWVEVRSTTDGTVRDSWRGSQAAQVAWDPAGRWLSYVTREAPRGGNASDAPRSTLWLVDHASGEARPLVERVERFGGYLWAPDGRHVVYWSATRPEPDARGVKRLEGLMDRWRDYRTRTALHLAAVPDGTRRTLTAGSVSARAHAFSPDGRRLLFTRTIEDLSERPFSKIELSELDLGTFTRRTLRVSRWLQSAQYAPDGRRLLLRSGPSEFGAAGVNVPAGVVPNESDGQLYVWDPASDTVQAITRGFDPAVQSAFWSRTDGHIYMTVVERDTQPLYRYDEGQAAFTRLAAPLEVLTSVEFAEGAPVAVAVGSSPWQAPGLLAFDLRRGEAKAIQWPAAERMAGTKVGSVESWPVTLASGTTIDGRVYLPPDFDPAKKYPLIVNYYGGTTPVARDFGGRYPKEWWASQGYVVYVPQPSGAIGYGQAFSAAHVNNWGKTVAGEIVDATRRFLEAHPFVDPSRVGCIGASYGGFMTMLLLTETDLFAAGVSHAGISSLASYWGEGYWGYSYSALATADSYPWNRRDLYVDQSPLFRADRVKTPLLLTHGTADTNVPVGESDAFYVALKLVGAPVEYLQVEGLDHLILEHPKRLVWSRSLMAWFDRWLKDEPAWWNDLWPAPGGAAADTAGTR